VASSQAYPELADLVDLSGNVALVTGAAQGFGFACARRLAEAGASVMLADLRADRLEGARERLASEDHAVASVEGDISVEADVDRLVAAAVERFGRLDVLVNNAGIFSNFLLEHMTPAEFDRIIGVNVSGTFMCIKAAAAQMRKQGSGGSIVNISSIDAVHPSGSGLSHYGTSKHAIWGLTKTMALELGPDRIRVNAVAPGLIATRMTAGMQGNPAVERPQLDRTAMKRWGQPDEVAPTFLYLASAAARFITGTTVCVDGGYTAT
jgi:2-dehydro-3-deoxy-D-gluconate 5-dehydrogenase